VPPADNSKGGSERTLGGGAWKGFGSLTNLVGGGREGGRGGEGREGGREGWLISVYIDYVLLNHNVFDMFRSLESVPSRF
jgi:hypothetical protein